MKSLVQHMKIVIKNRKYIQIDYTNYRNKRNVRIVQPNEIIFEETYFHKGKQWILYAYDPTKKDMRCFACKDIHSFKIQIEKI